MKERGRVGRASRAMTLLTTSLLIAVPARADTYDASLVSAVAAKERAIDNNDPPHWEEALRLFQEVDAIRSTRESRYEIGVAAAQLRQNDLAVEAYESALALGLEGPARNKAASFVGHHLPQMGRLMIHGPAESRVRIRGLDRGHLPLHKPLVVFAGHITATVFLPGGTRIVRELEVLPSTPVEVTIHDPQQPRPAEPRLRTGPERLATASGPPSPSPGANSSGRRSADATKHPADPRHRTRLLLAATGTTVASLGAVFVGLSVTMLDERRDQLARECADQRSGPDGCVHSKWARQAVAQSIADSIATWRTVQTGSWIAVGAGLVAAAAGAFWVMRPVASQGLAPQPTLGGDQIGLLWQGEF